MWKLAALFCMLFLSGCITTQSEMAPNQFDRDFFRLSIDERVRTFHNYDFETQYELLIIGNQVVHPPALYLIEEFAKNGDAVIPLLYEKLSSTKKEVTVRDIVMVLSDMQRLGVYEVRENSDLMALVKNRVGAMSSLWKSIARNKLDEIQDFPLSCPISK